MRVFLGCAVEDNSIATAFANRLNQPGLVLRRWDQGHFALSHGTLADLVRAARDSDFAILVFSGNDVIASRGVEQSGPRDNVVFEAGLFVGRLGPERTFIVFNQDAKLKIPSDLAGITLAPYQLGAGRSLDESMSYAATLVAERIARLGPRPRRRVFDDVDATHAYIFELMKNPATRIIKQAALATSSFSIGGLVKEYEDHLLDFVRRDGTTFRYVYNTLGPPALIERRRARAGQAAAAATDDSHLVEIREIERSSQNLSVILFHTGSRWEAVTFETERVDHQRFTLYQSLESTRMWELYFDEVWRTATPPAKPS